MYEKHILAPGIILYRTGKDAVDGFVDDIESRFGNSWKEAKVVNTDTYEAETSEGRKCFDVIIQEGDQSIQPLYEKIDNWIKPAFEDFTNTYFIEKVVSDSYLLLKYGNEGKFDDHVDDGGKFPRTVSVSAYINDEYSGGELEFNNFNVVHKPIAGDIVFFCSAFPYMHKVSPVTEGVRYAIVNWYRYSTYLKEVL